ncbi:MAG: hypothetical protein COV45_09340 [Deltaproteobacteria bacterium CG11_big_fil_rev_8_21_14_0_20_47_16]|nr:MAG: hypothetical protein COV45_09340 [Deltaproteobacteria bacterium CG11_big_fil_rev_8_21_14_0_20_47_16]
MKRKLITIILVVVYALQLASPLYAQDTTDVSAPISEPKPKQKIRIPLAFKHAAGDIRYTFGYWPALIIAGGAIAAGALTAVDHSVASHFTSRHLGKLDDIGNYIGSPYVLNPAAFVVWGASALAHDKKATVTGETLVESLLFADVMVGGLKLAFRRTRPNGGNYSFPSGHAAGTFAVATSLQTLFGWKAGVPAYAVATFVGLTRIDMNAHYLSDVVFGAALGSAIGWGTAHYHKLIHKNLFVMPMMGGNSTGVNISGTF